MNTSDSNSEIKPAGNVAERRKRRVAIQGVAGCWHDAAARAAFPDDDVVPVEADTFDDMFEMLAADTSLMAVVAIENTIAGSLMQNHELLRASNHRVVGEVKMRITHSLAALPGQSLDDITEVWSHPMALMQCARYLRNHPAMKKMEHHDTAGSAREIAERGLAGRASVCSRLAAELYGLEVIADGIETNKHNFTRFLILADPPELPLFSTEGDVDKASIVFTLPHEKGALSKILTILSFYDINLSKIQSSPIVGREWEYRFYVDLTFESVVRYRQAIEAVRPLLGEFRVLGEYKAI